MEDKPDVSGTEGKAAQPGPTERSFFFVRV